MVVQHITMGLGLLCNANSGSNPLADDLATEQSAIDIELSSYCKHCKSLAIPSLGWELDAALKI